MLSDEKTAATAQPRFPEKLSPIHTVTEYKNDDDDDDVLFQSQSTTEVLTLEVRRMENHVSLMYKKDAM